jgi:hypothetical protein
MRPMLPVLVAAFVTAVGVADCATAENDGHTLVLDHLVSGREHAIEPVPAPATGVVLFAQMELDPGFDSTSQSCVPAAQALRIFAREVEMIGGEIMTLTGRLQQDFSDQWRRTAGLALVDVSQVFAHLVSVQDEDAIADVVEIDTKGCAFSRTFLTGIEWMNLIQSARGPGV